MSLSNGWIISHKLNNCGKGWYNPIFILPTKQKRLDHPIGIHSTNETKLDSPIHLTKEVSWWPLLYDSCVFHVLYSNSYLLCSSSMFSTLRRSWSTLILFYSYASRIMGSSEVLNICRLMIQLTSQSGILMLMATHGNFKTYTGGLFFFSWSFEPSICRRTTGDVRTKFPGIYATIFFVVWWEKNLWAHV